MSKNILQQILRDRWLLIVYKLIKIVLKVF